MIPIKYDELGGFFYENTNQARLSDKWGIIDKTDKVVIPFIYDETISFTMGLALVKLNDKYGFVNKDGKVVIDIKYDEAYPFADNGTAQVTLDGQEFYINLNGECVRDCENAPADHPRQKK